MTSETVGCVSTLYDRTELGIAHSGFLTRRTHASRADSDLDDVSARQDQLLHHFPRNHITRL